ncbi:LPS assembly lipoprotein LptE [Desulfogranum mediterraneum]|uniref:LPS assembly lipoprotein LptE n=1 Tax=Desulfogranum mediterraneum TaxID=160661 RepID=UPI0003FEAC60|nr:LPS assembly lipoprotein LptE [Desulfogranum mediterraneum]
MNIKFRGLAVIALLVLCLCSCSAYYFPHVYDGPSRVIYMPTWENRTNKLGLDAQIYQSLSRWFLKSESINLTKDRGAADLIMAGEIVSISLPSISWDGQSNATDIKVRLGVRYVLKDLQSGEILWEVPQQLWTEDYPAQTPNATIEDETLATIVDDLSESIYLGTLKKIRRQNSQTTAVTN